ncbi:hypothetical protein [Mycolicibacterium elephantis]|uniref:hypothetical protein n=1 Tax=Mycolicibacterium elephantis TaxID=81858 RepID=UPI0007E977C3|nr:hypothetical protein [Mycolicibacterium elephantis]OBB22127.1 hypothetical protein A5762_14610 [Mycolicibacterium elephantis]
MEVLGFLFLWALFGGVGALIAQSKNRSLLEGFLLGGLCGCFGVIVEALLPKRQPPAPPAPPGMRSTMCPRCNAIQNVYLNAQTFECWQCHITVRTGVAGASPKPIPTKPASPVVPKDPEKTRDITCPACNAKLKVRPAAKKFRCVKCDAVSDAPQL